MLEFELSVSMAAPLLTCTWTVYCMFVVAIFFLSASARSKASRVEWVEQLSNDT